MPPPASLRPIVLLLIYAAFASMGLPDGILGAAWPQMRAQFGVGLNDNWPMLVLGTCGAALSSFGSGLALRHLGTARVLIFTAFLTSLVIGGYALSATFGVLTALALLLGLGNGAIDAGLNLFVANHLSARHMSWLHAFWGVGVSLGTLIVSGVFALGGSWRGAYMVVGAVQLLLALAFLGNRRSLAKAMARPQALHASTSPSYAATFVLRNAWACIAAFFTYCGLECSTGLWIASVLHDGRGWSLEAVGLMTTLYWASLTVGRFFTGILTQRMKAIAIVRYAVAGVLAGTLLITWSSLGVEQDSTAGVITGIGLLMTGVCLSPIYPLLMHDTPRVVSSEHAVNLIGFQGGAGQLGFTAIPIAVGTVLQVYSTRWLGALLATLALTLLVLLALREPNEGAERA